MEGETLFQMFKRNRDERPDSVAFLLAEGETTRTVSWRAFALDVEAGGLLLAKFFPKATVALLGENSYDWMRAHVSAMFAGHVVVPLETNLTPAEIADRLAFTGVRILFHSPVCAERAHAVAKLLSGLHVLEFGSERYTLRMDEAKAALAAGRPGLFSLPPRDLAETSTIMFTSGTTSKPRGVELTLGTFGAFAESAARALPLAAGARSLMVLPLYHIFGIASVYFMLARGVALGVCPDFRRMYDGVKRFEVTGLFLVPALLEILAQKLEMRGEVKLDWVGTGGALLPERTRERFAKLRLKVIQVYGLTETCALFSMSPLDDPRPDTAGLASPISEVRVSEDGELLIRGPSVMKGYYREPALTAQAITEGWFHTGDTGTIDERGYVHVVGRRNRTIVLDSGKKIAPEELEERLMRLPGIHEALVSGDGTTRDLKAEVYATVPEETVQRQIAALNRQLPVYKRIRVIVARSEPFPRTGSGKIKVAKAIPPPAVGPDGKPVKPHDAAAFFKAYVLPLTIAAIVVMLVNVVKFVLSQCGVKLPDSLRTVEEIGEIILAILVLLVVLGVQHRNKIKALTLLKLKEGKDSNADNKCG